MDLLAKFKQRLFTAYEEPYDLSSDALETLNKHLKRNDSGGVGLDLSDKDVIAALIACVDEAYLADQESVSQQGRGQQHPQQSTSEYVPYNAS
ncbi:hypothetical protein IDAT_12840 [Pseudidiomarina atlantica]|uniref:Uncharacterized protein n=2 Tax=Pseudidiomarina atlantica TaxID=1517416 RepID=A0A094IKR9_9GAMM|nr:hypothetical protein IDAT_12840 [Pseudidiomarina atlantica]